MRTWLAPILALMACNAPGQDKVPDGADTDTEVSTSETDAVGETDETETDLVDDTAPPQDTDLDTDAPVVDPPCVPIGFSNTATEWTLPGDWSDAFLDPHSATTQTGNCIARRPTYVTLDMNADAIRDLVVTQEECAEGPVGRASWSVYLGGTTGFGAATTWPLPDDYDQATYDPFAATDVAADCQRGIPASTLIDMTGDRRPDLVVLQEPCRQVGELGATHWDVYVNTGTGFASTPTAWSLPSGYNLGIADPFEYNYNFAHCGQGNPSYRLRDMNADLLVDLVVTDEPCPLQPVGRTHWLVYSNTGGGFGPPADWDLPQDWSAATFEPFNDLSAEHDPTNGTPGFTLLDLTGDLMPELVILQEPQGFGPVGRSVLSMYVSSGTGFDLTPRTFDLPLDYDDAGTDPFADAVSDGICQFGQPRYSFRNLRGTPAVDLVVTQEPCGHGDLGRTHWDVYEAGPTGFLPALTWPVPDAFDDALFEPFSAFSRVAECDSGWPTYDTFDLRERARSELVVQNEPGCDGPLGRERWEVYSSICAP